MPAELDIEVSRNGDYFAGWWARDKITRVSLDTTGWSYSLQIKANAGGPGGIIASATFSDRDDPNGFVNVLIRGSDLSSVEGSMETVRLAYDFLAKDVDGIVVQQARGHILLTPGVSTI